MKNSVHIKQYKKKMNRDKKIKQSASETKITNIRTDKITKKQKTIYAIKDTHKGNTKKQKTVNNNINNNSNNNNLKVSQHQHPPVKPSRTGFQDF